eukprot:426046_1
MHDIVFIYILSIVFISGILYIYHTYISQSQQTFISYNEYNYTNFTYIPISQSQQHFGEHMHSLPETIIYLIQNKYNYQDTSIRRLNTRSRKYRRRPVINSPRHMKKFKPLSEPYISSIKDFPINKTCKLPNN